MTSRPLDSTAGEGYAELSLTPAYRQSIDDETIKLAVAIVDRMDVIDQLAEWKAEARRGPGGRPESFPGRAVLVAFVVCALSEQPLHAMRACHVMFHQLSPGWREALGVPEPPDEDNAAGWQRVYCNVRTRFLGILNLTDPSPTPKNRRLDDDTFRRLTAERKAQHTDEEWDERYDRLEWFANRILEASIGLLSRDVRRQWNGAIGVDGTLVRSHSRAEKRRRGGRVPKGRKPDIEFHSVDPDAAFYVRGADDGDDNSAEVAGKDKIAWGHEATLAISGSEDPDAQAGFPIS